MSWAQVGGYVGTLVAGGFVGSLLTYVLAPASERQKLRLEREKFDAQQSSASHARVRSALESGVSILEASLKMIMHLSVSQIEEFTDECKDVLPELNLSMITLSSEAALSMQCRKSLFDAGFSLNELIISIRSYVHDGTDENRKALDVQRIKASNQHREALTAAKAQLDSMN